MYENPGEIFFFCNGVLRRFISGGGCLFFVKALPKTEILLFLKVLQP